MQLFVNRVLWYWCSSYKYTKQVWPPLC